MERLFEKLRCCSNCGSIFSNYRTLLCKKCFSISELDMESAPFVRMSEENKTQINGYCLWRWVPGRNDALSALLLSIKGGQQERAFYFYAEKILQQRLSFGEVLRGETIIVPAPARQLGEKDHAWRLADSLSRVSGIPMIEILVKKTQLHQRELGRSGRQKIQLGFCENFSSEITQEKNIIFVDDVVTTGATAFAARGKFTNCKTFEVWCLAQREPCPDQ